MISLVSLVMKVRFLETKSMSDVFCFHRGIGKVFRDGLFNLLLSLVFVSREMSSSNS